MGENIKLKDIAEALGVSVVTVSNALSGKKGVSEALRQEVLKKAEELGYDLVKYERKGSGGARIGVVVSDKYLEVGTSFYWAMYQQVACAVAQRQGFTMFEILERDADSRRQLPKILTEGVIDGLIVIGRLEERYIEGILTHARTPVVLLDFYDERFPCDAVMSNSYLGMYSATRLLLSQGHREIAFVGSIEATDNILDRYYGYRRGLTEYGIAMRPEWLIEDRDLETGNIHFELPQPLPTAFVCNSDYTAGFLYDRLAERGLRVPEDISVVGYDDYLFNHPFAERLTTYHVDIEQMARTAVDILLKKLRKNDRYRGVRYVDGWIVERGSVAPPKKS